MKIPMMHEDFMRQAIRLASDNEAIEGGPFGAVVIHNQRIVGRGQNRVIRALDPSAHAEIVAIREACQNLGTHHLQNCLLYTSCEPCPMCLAAIYWARLDGIYYAASQEDAAAAGFDDAFLYSELAKPIAERQMPMFRLLAEEGQIPFQVWQTNPNKKLY